MPFEETGIEAHWAWGEGPVPAARRPRAHLSLDADGALLLRVEAPFWGDPAPPRPAGATPGLWTHEVVELFIATGTRAADGPTEYLEIELGPHGHHWVLRFDDVRRPTAEGLPIDYHAAIDPPRDEFADSVPEGLEGGPSERSERAGARRWRGTARIAAEHLPPPPHHVALFAIHGAEPRRHLLSTRLPGSDGSAPADFHQPAHFPLLGIPQRA